MLHGSPFDFYAKLQKKQAFLISIFAISSCGKMRICHKGCFLRNYTSNVNEVQIHGPHLESVPRFKRKNTLREQTFPPVFEVDCFPVGEQGQVTIIRISIKTNIMLQKYFL